MRINKYRGRRSYDKKWIHGSLLIDNNGDFHILEPNIIEKDGHHIHIDSDSPMFFDNDTVGQFTGLHDKNGVEIYEGDIVCTPYIDCIFGDMVNNIIDKDFKWTVVFKDGRFCVENEDRIIPVYKFSNGHNIEVIGNIHERSEDNDK